MHITPGGAVRMANSNPQLTPNGDHWLVARTGCALNGTFPTYHGHSDGEHLYASTRFHSICDGGVVWGDTFGIGKEGGPLHVTFDISLDVEH